MTVDYEEQLLLAKQGNATAFEVLIRHFERLIYSIAYRMMNNREDARDLAQEALIKVYRSMDKCEDINGFKNWVCRITTNVCIDEIRKRKNKQAVSIDAHGENEASILDARASDEKTPEEVVLDGERAAKIKAAINSLSETHRALIILREIKGLSYEEVADALDMNLGTVKSGIARARLRLRELLTSEQ